MIRALLVDDESVLRKGLVKHIRWSELGVDELRDVGTGDEAIELAKRFPPDLMISDIMMPAVDGIELGSRIRWMFPACKLIYISGYADKKYLKAAIALSAVSYVEKPIDLAEIQSVIQKAVSMTREERRRETREQSRSELISENMEYIRQDLVHSLLSARKDPEKIVKFLGAIDIPLNPAGVYAVLLFCVDDAGGRAGDEAAPARDALLPLLERRLAGTCHLCGRKGKNQAVAILSTEEGQTGFADCVEQLCRELREDARGLLGGRFRLYCAAGAPVKGLERVCESGFAADNGIARAVFYGRSGVVMQPAGCVRTCAGPAGAAAEFARRLREQPEEDAVAFVESLCAKLEAQETGPVGSVQEMLGRLAETAVREAGRDVPASGEGDAAAPCELCTFEELKEDLFRKTRAFYERKREEKAGNSLIAEAIRYINEHFSDDALTVKVLAAHVYLTPNYFSFLFKKTTGQTVNAYITETRLQRSRELLLNGRLKLYEVAQGAGFSDANYYAKIFRKTTGMSPSQFREKHAGC